jgi:hypothetical protein
VQRKGYSFALAQIKFLGTRERFRLCGWVYLQPFWALCDEAANKIRGARDSKLSQNSSRYDNSAVQLKQNMGPANQDQIV